MVQNMESLIKIGSDPLKEDLRNWIRRKNGKRSLKQLSRIIAPSQYVRNFFIRCWNISGNKIGLVYHGVGLPEKAVYRPEIIPKNGMVGFCLIYASCFSFGCIILPGNSVKLNLKT